MRGHKKIDTGERPAPVEIFKEYVQAIVLAVVLALIVRSFIVQPFHIPSGSMDPTFLEGDRVLVSKFAYGVRNPLNNKVLVGTGRPERWDVVVFIAPHEPDKDFVKRVAALPGETVAITRGELFIDGVRMDDPHAVYKNAAISRSSRNYGPRKLLADEYFMMGDNRDNSSDSRVWGPASLSLMKGRAWRLYWSWNSLDPSLGFFERLRASRIGKRVE